MIQIEYMAIYIYGKFTLQSHSIGLTQIFYLNARKDNVDRKIKYIKATTFIYTYISMYLFLKYTKCNLLRLFFHTCNNSIG